MYICRVIKNKGIMTELKITFEAAKNDIVNAWEFPLRKDARITRDWIYGVDPETMDFVKTVSQVMPGHYSLYTTFTRIMKVKKFEEFLKA